MKILAINNYDLEWAYNEPGKVPMHQTWGVDYMRELGHQVDTMTYINRGGQLKLLKFNLALLKKAFCYDVIISFYSPCIYVLAYLKVLGIIKAKLYTFVHHHGKRLYVPKGFDGLIYLSKNIKDLDDKLYHLNNSYLIDWNPQLAFYEESYLEMNDTKSIRYRNPIFISTGKSSRNHQLLVAACHDLRCKAIIFDKCIISDNYISGEVPQGYPYMLKKMSQSAINIVPCKNRGTNTGLCGLTSVIDGLALGIPLLMSDNTNISFDIEKEGFGLYYKADNLEDLKEKMNYMISNPKVLENMGNKARAFALKHNYSDYCSKLMDIILK